MTLLATILDHPVPEVVYLSLVLAVDHEGDCFSEFDVGVLAVESEKLLAREHEAGYHGVGGDDVGGFSTEEGSIVGGGFFGLIVVEPEKWGDFLVGEGGHIGGWAVEEKVEKERVED